MMIINYKITKKEDANTTNKSFQQNNAAMRIITGDECGLLKETIPEIADPDIDGKKTKLLPYSGISRLENDARKMCRSQGVVDMAFCKRKGVKVAGTTSQEGSFAFCAMRANGSLDYWLGDAPNKSKEDRSSSGKYSLMHTIDNIFHVKDKENNSSSIGRPVAMNCAQQYQNFTENTCRSNIIACCSSSGLVSVVDVNKFNEGVQAHYYAFGKGNDRDTLNSIKGNFTNRDVATTMAMDHFAKRVVVGGRERSAIMLDLESGKNLWKAKNLPPNPQTLLQQPIWSTASQFLSQTTSIGDSSNLLALGTAYKQLQIYDVRADATQRRPVLYTPEWDVNKENLLDHRVTSLCQLDENRIAIGDAAGFVTALDLRKINNQKGRSTSANVGRFNGSAGSVRQIVKHETLPIISCVGLDRMIRTYDTNTRKQLNVIYLKQRLNCMLFCSDGLLGEEYDHNNMIDVDASSVIDGEIEGNIDDADEVVDYIDSSADDMSEEDVEEDDDNDNHFSDPEHELADFGEGSPKVKRQRR